MSEQEDRKADGRQAEGELTENPAAGGGRVTFEDFVARIKYLRGPDGCPWDRKQTHASIAKNMIEEAYEAAETLEDDDTDGMREELGDVLLQVVLQSQIAADAGEFTIDDVIAEIDAKIVRRHPHVFGEGSRETDAADALSRWEHVKLEEKAAQAALSTAEQGDHVAIPSLLASVPRALPALMQAQNISRKAVSAGFEWETIDDVWAQVNEEVVEFKETKRGSREAQEEFGDVLFSLVNVARKEGIDAETALRLACDKFRRRWAIMEEYAAEDGRRIDDYSEIEQESFWNKAKKRENQ